MAVATSVLRHEHEAILRMLDVADEVSRRVERGVPVAPEAFSGLVEFFRLFADKCHHGKEEDLLFPALEGKGLPREGGPVGVMLIEHDQGRAYMKEMAAVAEAIVKGNADAVRRWVAAARGYSDLLRAHIQKENNILFVMAERILSDDEQAELARGFERIEIDKMGAGTHERLHAMMDKLVAEFLG